MTKFDVVPLRGRSKYDGCFFLFYSAVSTDTARYVARVINQFIFEHLVARTSMTLDNLERSKVIQRRNDRLMSVMVTYLSYDII